MSYRAKWKFGLVRSVFVGVCLIFAFPQPLAAFELFGIHLFGKKKTNFPPRDTNSAEKFYEVDIVTPPGAPSAGVKIVKAVSSLIADKNKAVLSSSGLLAKARSDYKAILFALYADGRYGGVISIKINGAEVANLSPVIQLPDRSRIIITIDAGPQYIFRSARVNTVTQCAKYQTDKMLSVEDLGFEAGAIAKSETILKTEQQAIKGWNQKGYAKASVVSRDVVADHAKRLVDVQIVIDPGREAYYGSLNVRNVSEQPRADSAYVAWMTGLKAGQKYNINELAKANERLVRLGVFRSANLREADEISSDGRLPFTLILEERKPQRFGVGGSYSTLDGAGLEAYWMHRNLFGRAERLKIETKMSGIGNSRTKSYNPSNFNYRFGAEFTKPGIITPDTDFRAELKVQRDILNNYTTTAVKGKWGITHLFNDNLSGRIVVALSNGYSRDNYFGGRNFTTIGVRSGIIYDSRDDQPNATKGLYGEAIFEPLYEMRLHNFATKMTIEGRSYLALDARDHLIFATRAKLGTIIGSDTLRLPSSALFFAGGGGSVRGYAYRNIGIKTKNDTVIGGRALVEGSAELRFAVSDKIGLVSFIDGGLVGEKAFFDFSQKIKWGAGIGGRYMTDIGPLRFDLAFPLQRERGDPNVGFYVGIGQAF
ncbi:putative outer membrane protein [Bartonella australis AUST/NH1]|uniref:Putative outer membrane protein n=1 Tax=Bartonella australis (strain Aust/NH1) TaxID=1094489 RepID=M1NWR8_BARAA|nr:autotransporter assembly complex family protein [Bartonella australis]AGF73932.1 putative outer membrane protein [Bartonella australis AUST/NH1]